VGRGVSEARIRCVTSLVHRKAPVTSDPDRASASHSLPALGSTGLQAAFQSACS